MVIMNNESGKYAANIVQTAVDPQMDPDFKEIYNRFAKRIVWIDDDVVPGAIQMNTAWYHSDPERDPIFEEHVHEDADELIGFFGSDPEHPNELNAEIEFTIGGEVHLLTKSTIIFVPAGTPHNPMRIRNVKKPMFHFSVVTTGKYDGTATYR
ncbi:MAG: cupin domain-containing protein [Coriobacteriales bacterium]|jgi:hypothetical protein